MPLCDAVGLERDATNDNIALYIRDAAGRNSGRLSCRMGGYLRVSWLGEKAYPRCERTQVQDRCPWMQVGEERFNSDEICHLYESSEYPLRRGGSGDG